MNISPFRISEFNRYFIYHSPQYPGYTCWCGLWNMPDKSVMLSFTQATGPFSGRHTAPMQVRERLSWPPEGHGQEYDMTGLMLERIFLRSTDAGCTWKPVGKEPFKTCMNGALGGGCEAALSDGTILQPVWGLFLPYDEAPRTGYIQRSADGGRSWSGTDIICKNDGYMFWPSRIRTLSDGRLAATGGLIRKCDEYSTRCSWAKIMEPVLFVSNDNAYSWNGPIKVLPEYQESDFVCTEEFDFAELDNGDLLLVIRAEVPGAFDPSEPGGRLQTRLLKRGDAWETSVIEPAPFHHSGAPELLKTREGFIFHFATTGISYTSDEGKTWVDIPPLDGLDALGWNRKWTEYYPKSVQLDNGKILCVGHTGGDNGYGKADQAIIGISFLIDVK